MKEARIVFPEGENERILKAASIIVKKKIARVILLGNIEKILEKIEKLKLRFNVSIINPETATEREIYKQKLYEMRRKKGMSVADAMNLINDRNYFACMMLHENDCDAVLSGSVFSTPEMLKPAFQIIKTAKEIGRASGAILLKAKGKEYLFADCSVQENPNAQELAEIAQLSARTFKSLTGKKARIAMLSYHTRSSVGISENYAKMRKATDIARKKGLNAEGEIQLDAAIEKETSLRKKIKFIDANVLIFPDLSSGNIGYKLVKILAKAKMTGVIIQGLKKPVNNLSRGCSIEDIIELARATVKLM
jgi:phosphate acetyltransferase